MANFKTHTITAGIISLATASIAVNAHLIIYAEAVWLVFIGVIGGMLPDIDAGNSKPVRLLFTALATLAALLAIQIYAGHLNSLGLLMLAVVAYLLTRYGTFMLFNKLTRHRGVFHSVLAALFFTLLATCISHYWLHWHAVHAWLNGVFIGLGFIVHLLLDELYSVDLSNTKMKKSFGTALKLFSYNSMGASLLMMACTIALYWLAPSPQPLLMNLAAKHWAGELLP